MRPHPTFLSIDIDFWNDIVKWNSNKTRWKSMKLAADQLNQYLEKVTQIARQRGVPISACTNHQQMLNKVNKSGAYRLINVDTHSDLANDKVSEFGCGTWVSYVKWRKKGIYLWIRSRRDCGDCNGGKKIFEAKKINDNLSDWYLLRQNCEKESPEVEFSTNGMVEACVCSSPGYSDQELLPVFRNWVKEARIPYTKGTMRNDNYHYYRKPV